MQNGDSLHSRKKKWHFSVDKDFLIGRGLSPMARMLYLVLTSYASPDSPVPFPGMKLLASILDCTEDTVRKYRQELEKHGWLMVERRRNGHHKFMRNAYYLLDGPEEPEAMPKKPDTAFSRHGSDPTRLEHGNKSVPVYKEKKQAKPRSTTTSNTPPAADVAAPASEDSASPEAGAAAPEPPHALPTPESRAEHFIKGYMTWAARAKFISTVIPREREALIGFFKMNPQWDHRGLLALMLLAWQAPKKADEEGLQPWWHCNNKGWRIKTFLDFLTNIQDEVGWQGTEKQVNRAFNGAEKFFPA